MKEWGEKWWTPDVGAGSLQEEVEHALQVVVGGCRDYWQPWEALQQSEAVFCVCSKLAEECDALQESPLAHDGQR